MAGAITEKLMNIFRFLADSKRVVFLITAFVTIYVYHFRVQRDIWGSAVIMDGVGYYAYLPYVFETGATTFEGYCEFSQDNPCGPFFMRGPEDARVDKYYAGCALLWTPFYLAARGIEALSGSDSIGYSKTTFLSIAFAGCFYLFLALYAFRRMLLLLDINDRLISLSLILLTFFTNVFWYAAREPSMSHNYSLALFCLLFWQLLEWKKTPARAKALTIFALLAVIALVRPTNMLVLLFFPFFLGLNGSLRLCFSYYAWPVFFVIAGIQPLLYFLQTGHWWLWSYEGESFDFSNPHLLDTWFGPHKGLAVFFPVFGLILIASAWWLIRERSKGLWIILPAIIVFYLLSSWHAWQYGWSFGMRAYIEFYPLLLLPLVFFLERNRSKMALLALLPCLFVTVRVQSVAMNDYASLQDLSWKKWEDIILFGEVISRD